MTMNSSKKSRISVIITAAGSSSRIGGGIKKEYLPYKNGTVLSRCAIAFLKAAIKNNWNLSHFIITYPKGGLDDSKEAVLSDSELKSLIKNFSKQNGSAEDDLILFVEGSFSRQASVFNALDYIQSNGKTDVVLIHDGARPFVSGELIQNVADSVLKTGEGAVPGLTPTETIKEIDKDGKIIKHLKRISLASVQTPQGFDFEKLYLYHTKAQKEDYEFTDDTEIYGSFGGTVRVISGESENIKITYPKDLESIKE